MVKYKLTLSVDREIVDELKRRGICISQFLETSARDLFENSNKTETPEKKERKNFFKEFAEWVRSNHFCGGAS